MSQSKASIVAPRWLIPIILLVSCTPAEKPGAVVPQPIAVPLQAQIEKESAVAFAAAGRLEDALASTQAAIAAAPDWGEIYYIRAGILMAQAGPAATVERLAGRAQRASSPETFWEGTDSGAVETFAFAPNGTLRCIGKGCYAAKGTWKLAASRLILQFEDDGNVATYEGTLEADKRMRGTATPRFGDDAPGKSWAWEFRREPSPAELVTLLDSAGQDLQTFLTKKPDADDKDSVLRVIADLRVRSKTASEIPGATSGNSAPALRATPAAPASP